MNNDRPEFKSSLEERIERIKRLGNLRLYYLKRFYDGHSIAEGYAQGWLELHFHITEDDAAPFCGRCRCLNSHQIIVGDDHEFIVFVEIAKFLKRLRPIASVVRLQPLDCCDMRLGQTFKISTFPPIEVVCAAFDRKLCTLSFFAGIQPGELPNQIIEGASQANGGISNKDLTSVGNDCGARLNHKRHLCFSRIYRQIGLSLNHRGFGLSGTNLSAENLQFMQVFVCPIYPQIGITQRWFQSNGPQQKRANTKDAEKL
jgi:hypothetical protein